MGFYKLFSRRQAEAKNEISDVFVYDCVTDTFRNQYVLMLKDALNAVYGGYNAAEQIVKTFCRESGRLALNGYSDPIESIYAFLLNSNAVDFLDLLDFSLFIIYKLNKFSEIAEAFIEEVNYRLKYNNMGYEFVSGELIRIDNLLIHKQIVKPALDLIADSRFSGANDEMRKAYEHRRKGDNKAAIVEACKSFESVIKSMFN